MYSVLFAYQTGVYVRLSSTSNSLKGDITQPVHGANVGLVLPLYALNQADFVHSSSSDTISLKETYTISAGDTDYYCYARLFISSGLLYGITAEKEGYDPVSAYQISNPAVYQPVNKLWLRARWKITSGLPYTSITGFYGIITPDPYHLPNYVAQQLNSQVDFGKLNTARLPGYQSLDVSAAYDLSLAGVHFTLTGTIINLYNKRNVFYINNVTGDVVYQLPTVWNLSLGWGI